ncbi:MAG TPA: L,D-transpeptidase family protein [Kiloniellales bacterium]|nr:L,D-transpeptidase family protein [Kiloniellales bacterium]
MRVLAYVIALGFTALLALPAAADVPRPPPAKPEQSLVQQSNLTLPAAREVQGPRADYILVNKSERYLKLFSDGEEIAHFPIQLGKQPIGHKLYEGDNRTPEGVYYIDWRNPESHYFRSLRISYPNSEDRAQAEAAGLDPGGMIMIHGMPNNVDYRLEVQDQKDWTNGCIALSDGDMLAVWDMVDVGTAIEILP